MSVADPHVAIRRYVEALEGASPETLDALLGLCDARIEFRDPFNHSTSKDQFEAILRHMFSQVAELKFVVHDVQGSGRDWFLKWTFTGHVSVIGAVEIEGISEVALNDEGKVHRHIDYWDATSTILFRIPLLGRLIWLLTKPMRP